jgi:hypothetical protein
MRKQLLQNSILTSQTNITRAAWFFIAVFFVTGFFVAVFGGLILNRASAQNVVLAQTVAAPTAFRIGERLTYNISLGKFVNAGYAETYVVSRGKIANKDAVELRSKIKTNDFVSAAFYLLDESRTTFAAADSGAPLYIREIENGSVLPKETLYNYLVAPSASLDWLTLVYQARATGGTGNFSLQEDEKVYNVNLATTGGERIKTDAGDFETTVSNVQSDFFVERGWKDFRINFSADEQKIPVLLRFKTSKGEFRVSLASVQFIEGETTAQPTPIAPPTPRPVITPTPIPTPTPYIDNQPLIKELPFDLGETLDYQVSTGGSTIGNIRFQAAERKQFLGQDSLLLKATVTNVVPGSRVFNLNEGIRAFVNPDSTAPQQIEIKLSGALAFLNQTTQFDQRTGKASLNGINRIDIPVGTHSILSLIYAIRSFNLKPSKDLTNPVNDTRVAVFWDKQPYVFTLRPADANIINLRGEKISAQQISINTGNPQLDALGLRLWLSNDERRVPLRFTVGAYQVDLVAESVEQPK